MVKTNNAAGRLYQVLARARAQPKPESTSKVWASVFGLGEDDVIGVYHCLIVMQGVLDEVERELVSIPELNTELYLSCVPQIQKVITPIQLNATWTHYGEHLSESVMTTLAFCADKLAEFASEVPIEPDELNGLQADVDSLFERVERSSLDPLLKEIVLDFLEAIRRAVVEYRLRGARALREVLEATIGAFYTNWDVFQEAKAEDEIRRFMGLLENIQLLVTKALHIKAIATGAVKGVMKLIGVDDPGS